MTGCVRPATVSSNTKRGFAGDCARGCVARGLAVQEKPVVPHLNHVAGHSDNPFHEPFAVGW